MTRNQVFSHLESKYETWLSGLKQNGFAAANHYVANLKAIGEPITPHTANTAKWNGLFELLTGTRPAKGVFEISGVAEFARVYGAAVSFFTAEKGEKEQIRPLYPNCNCFDDLFAFVYQNGNATTLGDGGHTRNGFVKYCQFLCELESSVQDDMAVQQQIIGEPLQRITYGAPGTGKTLLALAAALQQNKDYKQILLARPIVAMSNKDLGFLPGDQKQKVAPYMQPLFDNLNVIKRQFGANSKELALLDEMQKEERLVIEALAFIRGRSLSDTYVIVDEAQNLTPHEIKTIITRAGEGCKMVFTGDVQQIDAPYLDMQSNGLAYMIDKMKGQEIFEHVNLVKGERSKLSEIASKLL